MIRPLVENHKLLTHSCLLTLRTTHDDVQQFKFGFQTYLVKS
jgi:hypothetical protein